MTVPSILLRSLAYTGPDRPAVPVTFQRGLNVICGASDTGKSFIAESVDFMLGGGDTPRDIPERVGYDRTSLTVELPEEQKTYRLERSTGGGDFRRIDLAEPDADPIDLHAKHAQGREDSLSAWLLSVIGLSGKKIRTNARGVLRSLSFRDIARLVVLQQGEISSKTSPYLTGQYILKTAEMSALKLLLTGVDDSAVVRARSPIEVETSAAKVDVLDSTIDQLRSEVADADSTAEELSSQLDRLQGAMSAANTDLRQAQQRLEDQLKLRREAYGSLERTNARRDEIDNLLARFDLLHKHYSVDLQRLAAIAEAGQFILHLPNGPCPLCGAAPEQQHTGRQCDGNLASVAEAANGEQAKVRRLLKELVVTVDELKAESVNLDTEKYRLTGVTDALDQDIRATLSPSVGKLREDYSVLVKKASEVRRKLDLLALISTLEERKAKLTVIPETPSAHSAEIDTDLSKSVLHDLCLIVERILAAWNFPGAGRVSFDDRAWDFVCEGKPRSSFGAGFRAIISAAGSIGLLEYCLERDRPHPGFVVLESPLLAYWKPESSEDNLQGSDLKDRFYGYLNEKHRMNQIIVIENEHPPLTVDLGSRLTVFTRNRTEGRYGFFPPV